MSGSIQRILPKMGERNDHCPGISLAGERDEKREGKVQYQHRLLLFCPDFDEEGGLFFILIFRCNDLGPCLSYRQHQLRPLSSFLSSVGSTLLKPFKISVTTAQSYSP